MKIFQPTISGSVEVSGSMTVSGSLSMASNNITNLANPVNSQDAATRAWVLSTLGTFFTSLMFTFTAAGTPVLTTQASTTVTDGTNGAFMVLDTSGSKIV